MFGATSASPFGAPQQQANPFGASSAPAFGQASTSGGGLFGARPFGAPSSSPFGTPQPQGGGLFGAATSTGGLGATQSAFGATPAFGQTSSAPAFGGTATFGSPQQSNPFGGATFGSSQPAFGSTPFGASSAPAFGASSAPAFGASSTPAFGTSTFGATGSAFGTGAFGASSTPAFGTFGQTAPGFGSATGGAFGATATPAFGASTTPFGQTSSAFGAVSTTPAFGAGAFGAGGFGAQQKGSRWKRFEPTVEADGNTGGVQGKFQTITAMKEYQGKSVEELRLEDYANNDKGGAAPAPAGGGMFGQAAATPFGSPPASSPSPFGASTPSPFGASTPGGIFGGAPAAAGPFGQPATTSAFGGATASAFGSTPFGGNTQPSPFGAPAAQAPNPFAAPATGSAFGASSSPGFGFGGTSQSSFGGAAFGSTPAFGQTQAAPIFGQSTGTFGQSSSAFGASNAFGASSSPFGSSFTSGAFAAPATTSAFGAPSSSSLFGNQTSGSLFGNQGTSAFGAFQNKPAGLTLSTPASSGGIFGTPAQQPNTGSAFGFGGGGIFGGAPTQAAQSTLFGAGGGFGTSQPSANLGFSSAPSGFQSFSFSPQPQQPQPAMGGAQPTLQPSPVANPYGTLPAMPQISIARSGGGSPAVQYGIASLPLPDRAPPMVRTTTTLTPRHITPRSRIRLQARKVTPRVSPGLKGGLFADGLDQSPPARADVLFAPRLDNPRTLFIREHALEYSLSPGAANGATPVKQLTHNGEGRQREQANGETPAKQSGAESPMTPESRATPQGGSASPAANGGEGGPKRTPSQNAVTPPPARAQDKGKQPLEKETQEGQASKAANGRAEAAAGVQSALPQLREAGYYTQPSLAELAAKERAERGYTQRVPDFVVGRKGYGSVRFLGETDVAGLDLQRIVIFNDKEVIVYPDEDAKPDVGAGLNKPAEVTVLNVKRFDKKTGEVVTSGPLLDKFERLLQEKTAEQGATFVSWDRERGEWKFRVEHFSRYGLDLEDDSDSEEGDTGTQKDRAQSMEGEGSELTFGDAQWGQAAEHNGDVRSEGGSALPHSLPSHLGLDPLRMHQMRATLFAHDEEDTVSRGSRQHTLQTPASKARFPFRSDLPLGSPARAPVPADEPPAAEEGGRPLAVWQRKRRGSDKRGGGSPASQAAVLAIAGPEGVPAKRPRVSVGFLEEAVDEVAAESGAGVDAGLFLGRSFRVGWGPGGVLLHAGGGSALGSPSRDRGKAALSSLVHVEQAPLARAPDVKAWFLEPLEIHRSHAVQEEGRGARRVRMACSRKELPLLCAFYAEVARRQAESEPCAVKDRVVALQEEAVWRLVDVLFSQLQPGSAGASATLEAGRSSDEEMEGPEEERGPTAGAGLGGLAAQGGPLEDEEVAERQRRARLSAWIQEYAGSAVDRDLEALQAEDDRKGKRAEGADSGSPMAAVLAHLTGRQLEEAVGVAVAAGDVRLATLLAQAGGSTEERADVARQVAAWQALHVEGHMDADRVRVYQLLAGNVDAALQGALPVDWKRYLGLLLWYAMPPDASLPAITSAYKGAWTAQASGAPAPLPLYVEEGARLGLPPPQVSAVLDSCYYLLLLYGAQQQGVDLASLHTMLRSGSSTWDPLDARLAWHLHSLLTAIGLPLPTAAEALHAAYAAQLEAAGLPEWALYTALHIEDPALREQSVKQSLERSCPQWSQEGETEDEDTGRDKAAFLREELNIPAEWMHAAQAQLSAASGDDAAQLEHLLASHQAERAHRLLMTTLAPQLFIQGEHAVLIGHTQALAESAPAISEWALGGQLYLDYYAVREALIADGEDRDQHLVGLEQRTAACQSLFERIARARTLWEDGKGGRHLSLVYSRMAEDLSRLLLIDTEKSAPTEALAAAAYSTLLHTPAPVDVLACRAQDAVTHFTQWLAQTAV